MKLGIVYFILFILLILIIYSLVLTNNTKKDLQEIIDRPTIPLHTHQPVSMSNQGDDNEQIPGNGLTIADVDARIRELAPHGRTVDGDITSVSLQELGFEYDNIGSKLIFNKPVDFNYQAEFNNQADFKDKVFIRDSLEGEDYFDASGNNIGSRLTIPGSVYVFEDINARNALIEDTLSSENDNINITPFANMIAPFFINFRNPDEIRNLESKHWYLCNGEDHRISRGAFIGDITRTTPDLRGRFIWGGGSRLNNSLVGMEDQEEELDTSYTQWGSNTGHVGGEGYHTLTYFEMPPHTHNTQARTDGGTHDSGDGWHLQNTHNKDEPYGNNLIIVNSAGGGKSHNNLPPYMVLAYFIYWPQPWN